MNQLVSYSAARTSFGSLPTVAPIHRNLSEADEIRLTVDVFRHYLKNDVPFDALKQIDRDILLLDCVDRYGHMLKGYNLPMFSMQVDSVIQSVESMARITHDQTRRHQQRDQLEMLRSKNNGLSKAF